MRGCFRVLALDVGDLEREIDQSHTEFERCLMHRTRREGRGDGWCDAAMSPRDHLPVLIKTGLDTFGGYGVQEVVTDVVLSRPLHVHRHTKFLGEQGRFQSKIALRFAPEPATEQRNVDGYILNWNVEGFGDVFARASGALHGGPNLGLVTLD